MVHIRDPRMLVQPLFVDAIDQVIAVVFGEAQLDAEDDVHAERFAGGLRGAIADEVSIDDRVPVVRNIEPRDLRVVQMVGHADAGVTEFMIGLDLLGSGHVPALAGFRGVQMQFVTVQGSSRFIL